MKTLVIDGIFFQLNEWSGIAKYWRTLLAALDDIASEDQGLRIFLLARGESKLLRNTAYKNIHILPAAYFDPVCGLSDFSELGDLCRALNASAFISSYYTLAYGVPNIGMAYDFIPEAMGWMANHAWKLKEIYMRSLTQCLSISKATAEAASLYYPNLHSSEADIFYPPMSSLECEATKQEDIRKLRIHHQLSYPYAAVVGHRGDYKNIDLLNTALKHRPAGSKPMALGIVATAGEPIDEEDIHLYAQHFQFGLKRLKLQPEEMPIFLNGAELLFYPSLLEGFGYPVAEALVQGCPVITTGATSIGEILQHAEQSDFQLITGHDGNEALRAIINLLHTRQRVSPQTRERIRQAFCKQDANRFLHRVLSLATEAALPHQPHLKACLSLDGLLA